MVNVSVARRYSRALLAAASDEADEVLAQLESVVEFLGRETSIAEALSSPTLGRTQRMAITDGLINASGGVKPALANLLRLLTDRNRFGALPGIARLFRETVDAKLGRVRGKITSAAPLAPAQLDAIRSELEQLGQKKLLLETSVDTSLLGGVVAQVGSKMYDGSLRSQLSQLGKRLTMPVR